MGPARALGVAQVVPALMGFQMVGFSGPERPASSPGASCLHFRRRGAGDCLLARGGVLSFAGLLSSALLSRLSVRPPRKDTPRSTAGWLVGSVLVGSTLVGSAGGRSLVGGLLAGRVAGGRLAPVLYGEASRAERRFGLLGHAEEKGQRVDRFALHTRDVSTTRSEILRSGRLSLQKPPPRKPPPRKPPPGPNRRR